MMKYINKVIKCTLILTTISASAMAIPKKSSLNYDKAMYEEIIKMSKAKFSGSPTDGIQPGMGYSSDIEGIARTLCYKPVSVTKSSQQSIVNFDTAIDVSSIANAFGVSADLTATRGKFTGSAMIEYLTSLQENSYSLSINYYQEVSNTVNMTYSYNPNDILTDVGKNIYNNGENPMFRLFCGDTLIRSYTEGAGLILSMRISFNDKAEKQLFQAKIGGSYGNIVNASAQIQNIANQYHLHGRITIKGYQLGGDPTQLSQIFSDPKSVFQCDLTNTSACQQAASGLLAYASDKFPPQFTRQGSVWVSPLVPLGGLARDYRLSDFGMKLAPSYVTQAVIDARNGLGAAYNNDNKYLTNLYAIINYFPAELDPQVKSSALANYHNANYNLSVLKSGVSSGTAEDCWQFPFRCENIAKELQAHMQPLNFDPSPLIYCDDPSPMYDVQAICGHDAQWPQFYCGDFFTPSKAPTSGGNCWARAHYHNHGFNQYNNPFSKQNKLNAGWDDCAGPQYYAPNRTFTRWD